MWLFPAIIEISWNLCQYRESVIFSHRWEYLEFAPIYGVRVYAIIGNISELAPLPMRYVDVPS